MAWVTRPCRLDSACCLCETMRAKPSSLHLLPALPSPPQQSPHQAPHLACLAHVLSQDAIAAAGRDPDPVMVEDVYFLAGRLDDLLRTCLAGSEAAGAAYCAIASVCTCMCPHVCVC